jgi:GH35 family endo-1,4-beta-xylanase
MSCKGHPLFWHYAEPTWLTSKDLSLVKAKILTYVNDQPTLHSARINVWDVVNEISTWDKSGFLASNSPAMTRIWLEEGYIPLLKEIFNTARAAAGPGAVLLANDFYINDNYYSALKRIDDGAGGYLFDAVGVQTHMHDEVYSNQKLWYMCNRFGSLTGSIHFTETSILSGPAYTSPGVRATTASGITIWDSTPEGEIQQALEVIRYYKLLFSHPYVKAITWWNASDYNSWMDAPRGLLDINMLPKQAYTELDNLINSEWWTTTSGVTDSSGEFTFRGFAGTYDITVSKAGYTTTTQSVTLTTSGNTWTITLT